MWYKNPLIEYHSWQAFTPMQIDLALFVFLSRRRTHAHDTIHRSHACRTYCIQTLQTLLPHSISFPAVLGLSGLLLTFRIKAVLGLRAILLTFRIKPVLGLHAILLTLTQQKIRTITFTIVSRKIHRAFNYFTMLK